ncbi:hypothetical protein GGS23DRAFT_606720 [Durotheca rogersii]|uniref:uncharacterized protein n=1 Tax=Durotheca rogersii TaxID=419775 RepID=UPI002220E4CE|nr:uncharacterized protein GGS23DRAFT_606720 [Durotheca rogersii]KAI5860683.1 hypothetical protein GGS23DRAFT_606720 [Durotheca rogersii]
MRNAIKAHQSLYAIGGVLHRDISPNNVIVTEPETADGFEDMLIDQDLAEVRDNGLSGAEHRTGTIPLMAIEVLRKASHTCRHYPESFFYVLLWEIGTFEEIADTKVGNMTENGLKVIMRHFPRSLDAIKPLCLRIGNILFPIENRRIKVGTRAGDPDQLYGPIIAAYDGAISGLSSTSM